MTLKSLSRAAFLKETAADVMPASTLCLPRDPVLPGMVRRHTHDNGFAQAVPYQMPQDCDSEWAGDSFASRMITPTRVDHIHTAVPTNRRRTSLSSHCVGLGSPINDVQQPRRMSNPVVKMRDPIRLFTEPSFYSMPANGSSHESFFANINECNLISPFFEDQIEDDVGYLGVDDDNFGIDENSANASGTTWIPPSIADMSIDELSGADIW